jgi:hypothetical protein
MMPDWPMEWLQRIGRKSDLMVWGYGERPDQTSSDYRTAVIEKFRDAGVHLWAATAYKGADACTMDLPVLQARAQNALAWVELAKRIPFEGIVATGWSRYSAHRPQNEPIDAALDVMLYIGAILKDGEPPAGGIDGCVEQLRALGQADRFVACHDALRDLATARRDAWTHVQHLREQIVLETCDPRRHEGGHARILLGLLRDARRQAEQAAVRVRSALNGFVADRWIEEYLHTRLAAIEAEIGESGSISAVPERGTG